MTQKKATKPIEWIFQFWAWQLLAWTLYRYFLHFPEWVDEFLMKPLVFVVPVVWYVLRREHRRLSTIGITTKQATHSVLIGFVVGAIFLLEGVVVSFVRHGGFRIQTVVTDLSSPLGLLVLLSLATACSEELLSRGFLLSRLYEQTKQFWYSILLSTGMFVAFHIPILVTSLKFQGPTLLLFFFTNIVIALINGMIVLQTKSLVAPVLIHFFWNMTVLLFL